MQELVGGRWPGRLSVLGRHGEGRPRSARYEQHRCDSEYGGRFPKLEDQYCAFSSAGYQGEDSPDHADAAIHGLSELMLGLMGPSSFHVPLVHSTPRMVI